MYNKTIKRDKTDILFSQLVRERVNWFCEYGGSSYCGRGSRHFTDSSDKQVLHCSHLFGRRGKGTRWHPLNGFSHCHECHRYLEENPVIFAEWARRELGEANYDRLRILSQQAYKND